MDNEKPITGSIPVSERVGKRVGSRGIYLFALGMTYVVYAWRAWYVPEMFTPPILLPDHWFTIAWIGAAIVAFAGAFCRRDGWAYLIVQVPLIIRIFASILALDDVDRDIGQSGTTILFYAGWIIMTVAMATTTGTRGIPVTLKGWIPYRVLTWKNGPERER